MRTNELLPLLPDLAVLVDVVEAGSFSAAARLQGSTPSAVSRQMARLEAALGLTLLERSTRRLRLTSGGQEVVRHARSMLDAARAACDGAARHASTVAGRVRLAAPKAALRQIIHPQLPLLLQTYPQLALELQVKRSAWRPDRRRRGHRAAAGRPARRLRGAAVHGGAHQAVRGAAYLAQHGTPQHPSELVRHSCLHLAEQAATTNGARCAITSAWW